jgi:hypothetical protein
VVATAYPVFTRAGILENNIFVPQKLSFDKGLLSVWNFEVWALKNLQSSPGGQLN